jgi:cytochrome oxidase Cu insertion factor (SCO1/SenC/PrrC family)
MMRRRYGNAHVLALAVAIAALSALPATRAVAGPVAAPAFTLELLDGKTLRLDDYKGSRVILLFWTPW